MCRKEGQTASEPPRSGRASTAALCQSFAVLLYVDFRVPMRPPPSGSRARYALHHRILRLDTQVYRVQPPQRSSIRTAHGGVRILVYNRGTMVGHPHFFAPVWSVGMTRTTTGSAWVSCAPNTRLTYNDAERQSSDVLHRHRAGVLFMALYKKGAASSPWLKRGVCAPIERMTKPREPTHTTTLIDAYCAHYRSVFANVRQFEQFMHLERGLVIAPTHKSLPQVAQVTKSNGQALHHFLTKADWSVESLHTVRLELTRRALRERPFILCVNESGDRKHGKTTDYAFRQTRRNGQSLANQVVSVTAYGVLDTLTFPLGFRIYKPPSRLKPGDVYKSKPQQAVELIREFAALGLHFSAVIVDSLHGENWELITALACLGLSHVVAIRSNQVVWTSPREHVPTRLWQPFVRNFTDGMSERRYICEFVFDSRARTRFFTITTDPIHLPADTTWNVMTTLRGNIEPIIGNAFGLRTRSDYGFKQAIHDLGWADYRVTDAARIERWWELVMCAYLLVSLQAPALALSMPNERPSTLTASGTRHEWTEDGSCWRHHLTTIRSLL